MNVVTICTRGFLQRRLGMRTATLFFVIALTIPYALSVRAQVPPATTDNFVKTHYAKFEFRIPMRDGVHLFTSVYVPKQGAFSSDGPWPILLDRTPYGVAPYGEDQLKTALGPSDEFEKAGYIFVYQDVRGRYMSEGEFLEMRPHIDVKRSEKDVDDSSDTYDSIDFLLKHVPNNNGRVGIWGISYPGFYTSASIIDSHPALKAASPQAPMTDLFLGDDTFRGGAFMLDATFYFYANRFFPFPKPAPETPYAPQVNLGPDTYAYYLNVGPTSNLDTHVLEGRNPLFTDQLRHTTYDSYWQARDLSRHLKNIHCAVMTVGGWFDAEDLSGPFKTYHAIGKDNPGIENTLVVGPWTHDGWRRSDGDHLGDVQFNAKTSLFFQKNIQFPFFEHYLRRAVSKALPEAYVFETGTNVWRQFDAWPPKQAVAKILYFRENGGLSFNAPATNGGSDQYVSDPARPVPFVGYTTNTIPQRYMDDDQRFAARRPDVLVYQTEPLTEDITIAGPVTPKLHIASTGTDSDFVVKLIDVYPDDFPGTDTSNDGKHVISSPPLIMGGYQQLVRGEPMRAKFRNSWMTPEPLTPGQATEVDFIMPDVFHTFRKGHRIMVQVQSSWFPLVDRNPQTFTDTPDARPEQFVKATETVFHTKAQASAVEVMVLLQP
jgi:putative CocE/NonD family hydrolase